MHKKENIKKQKSTFLTDEEKKQLVIINNNNLNIVNQKIEEINKQYEELKKNFDVVNQKNLKKYILIDKNLKKLNSKKNSFLKNLNELNNEKCIKKNIFQKISDKFKILFTKNTSENYVCKEENDYLKVISTKKLELVEKELRDLEDELIRIGNNESYSKNKKLKLISKIYKKEKNVKKRRQSIQIDLIHLNQNQYLKLNIFQKFHKYLSNLSYHQQKVACGILFILPWFIGFCMFFAKPLVTTIWWSFNDIKYTSDGLSISFVGLENYHKLFTSEMLGTRTFLEVLTISIQTMLFNVPVILIFSLLIAVVLNTKFKGHQIFKAIFFIPVIYNSSVIQTVLNGTFGDHMTSSIGNAANMLELFSKYLLDIGLGTDLITFLIGAVDRIFTIVNMSGIQIIIFIAALQSIPKHLYEAAKVEGATTYECFWKITFPMVSVMFLPVIIFSIVDSFGNSELINYMTKTADGLKMANGLSSTIAVIYFGINLIIILIVFGILRKVVYNND